MVNGVTFPEYLPKVSNGSPRTDSNLGHCITRRFTYFYEPEPAEDFRVFTQTCRIFNTCRFTNLRISRHHRVSLVYFELTILGSFPISRFLRLSRVFRTQLLGLSGSSAFLGLPLSVGLLISRYLDLHPLYSLAHHC